jgi:hypothetical protein
VYQISPPFLLGWNPSFHSLLLGNLVKGSRFLINVGYDLSGHTVPHPRRQISFLLCSNLLLWKTTQKTRQLLPMTPTFGCLQHTSRYVTEPVQVTSSCNSHLLVYLMTFINAQVA